MNPFFNSYLSTYFALYTGASSVQIGQAMLVVAVVTMLINLIFCSIADRYQAHRLLYLGSVAVSFVSFLILFVPMLASHKSPNPNHLMDQNELPVLPSIVLTGEETDSNINHPEQGASETASEFGSSSWFYMVAICVILGDSTVTLSMNLNDSFSSNIAMLCNRSYGSLRFWGSIGQVSSSIILSYINAWTWAPFLAPAWSLFIVLATINWLVAALWPNSDPFSMISESESPLDPDSGKSSKDHEEYKDSLEFSFKRRFALKSNKQRLSGYQQDLHLVGVPMNLGLVKQPIQMKTIDYKWDEVSAIDLGDAPSNKTSVRLNMKPFNGELINKQSNDQPTHFKFIAQISQQAAKESSKIDLKILEPDLKCSALSFDEVGRNFSASNVTATAEESPKSLGLGLHIKIIGMIMRRNKLVLRFLFLFMVNGFIVNMNLLYLFPFLRSIDESKFSSLSANVMVGCFLSEALFYYSNPKFTRYFSQSINLSIILLIYGLRYSLYLLLDGFHWIPLEFIFVIELSQALNLAWFYCVFNESSLEFALEARHCVPELIKLKLIENSQSSIRSVENGVRVTMLSIGSCCFDGIGMALGSFVGGWLVENYGYNLLWTLSASIAASVGLINLVIELKPGKSTSGLDDK